MEQAMKLGMEPGAMLYLTQLKSEKLQANGARARGNVVSVRGQSIIARLPGASIGDMCTIALRGGRELRAQVVSFSEELITLAPFDSINGLEPGAQVISSGSSPKLSISRDPRGQVLDALGMQMSLPDNLFSFNENSNEQITQQITQRSKQYSGLIPDGLVSDRSLEAEELLSLDLHAAPPAALTRKALTETLWTGVKAIDLCNTLAYGQRVGLFASAGVGKSTLLGMLARNAQVDVSVIALIGERGREVSEFIQHSLGPEGLKKSVLVVSTSDESATRRMQAAYTATAIAEHFRSQGKRVLLLVDSLTRMARAIREVSLAAGELPVRQGYTPTVYSELPKLLERAGSSAHGSISAVYTVLADSSAEMDPLADEIKSILDGHIVLSRDLAARGIRPAIDLTQSVSRLFDQLHGKEALAQRNTIKRLVARLKKDKDLVMLGGEADPELRACLELEPLLEKLLTQTPHQSFSSAECGAELLSVIDQFNTLTRVSLKRVTKIE
jgi:FliI/YscN family ATPase